MLVIKNGGPTQLSESSFAVRDLGFGDENLRNPLQEFVLRVAKIEFEAKLSPYYDEWLSEQKKLPGIEGQEEPQYLKALGYPPLSEFMNHSIELNDLFTRFLATDLLYAMLINEGDTGNFDFVINSVDLVETDGDSVNISIRAFARTK